MPKRLQRKRTRGWRKPDNCKIVDRTSRYGNPHRIGLCPVCGVDHTREEAIAEFRAEIKNGGEELANRIRADLGGYDLACTCELGDACHADVLLAVANEEVVIEEAMNEVGTLDR